VVREWSMVETSGWGLWMGWVDRHWPALSFVRLCQALLGVAGLCLGLPSFFRGWRVCIIAKINSKTHRNLKKQHT
jgi:hypothetical protein